MIISHLVLKNWRNFREVDVNLQERMFLVGPNASGKSNLLDAFRFLRDIAKQGGGGLQQAVKDRGGLSKIRCLAARAHPDVEIDISLSEAAGKRPLWRYAIGIKQETRGHRQPLLAYECVWKDGRQVLTRPNDKDKNDPLQLTQTHLEQINANGGFRVIAKFLEAILYMHLVPQLVRHPEAFSGPGIPGDPFGRSFLEHVARTTGGTRRARLKKIESALKVAVPQLNELTDTKDETGATHLEAIYQHWRPKGAKQREDQFSDGTLRLIGLLWSMLDGESLLLLEEPELSLHSEIVRKLAGLIYRLQRQRRRQVMVSTHSADLLMDKGIGGEEVLLLTPSVEGTTVAQASSKHAIRNLLEGGLSVADAVLPCTAPQNIVQLELFS